MKKFTDPKSQAIIQSGLCTPIQWNITSTPRNAVWYWNLIDSFIDLYSNVYSDNISSVDGVTIVILTAEDRELWTNA
jgi:hypothetical protein